MGKMSGLLDVIMGCFRGTVSLGRTELSPNIIVKRTAAIGEATMRHHTCRVAFQSAVKTLYALFVIETVTPVQPQIEPPLRLRSCRRDLSFVISQIKSIHCISNCMCTLFF
jgi:hypothetical protein